MIDTLHLLWIVPLSAWFGFFIAIMCVMAGRADKK